MAFKLKARNRNCPDEEFTHLAWESMLRITGMGYILNYGDAKESYQYIYKEGNLGSPVTNDGYRATAFEAKAMAMMARGFVFVQQEVNAEWDRLSVDERALHLSCTGVFKKEVDSSLLLALTRFADFAEKSKGFTIR